MAEFRRDEEMRAVLQQRTPKRSADLMQCIRHLHRRREIVDRRQCVNRQRGFEPSGTASCGSSVRTPCAVPYTVISLVPPLASSVASTVAVSPARKSSGSVCLVENPGSAIRTTYSPVSGSDGTV